MVEGVWNFTLMDEVVVPFLEAALLPNSSGKVILDIETSPQWMWEDAGACVPLPNGPHDSSCDGVPPDGRDKIRYLRVLA